MKRLSLLIPVLFLLCACQAEGGTKTLGSREIALSEWDYVFRVTTEQYEQSGAFALDWDGEIEGVPTRTYLERQAERSILRAYALEQMAAEYDCALTDEELGITAAEGEGEWGLRYGVRLPLLRDKVMDVIFGEGGPMEADRERVGAYCRETMVYCQYLYLSLRDEEGVRLNAEETRRLILVMEALQKQAESGEDFAALIDQNGQDYAMSESPDGLWLDPALYGDGFREDVRALTVGQISPVLETEDGLFIVRRLEGGEDWLETHFEELCTEYRFAEMDRLLDAEITS